MTEYKEIQEQTYLNLDNGDIYFAIEAVLRIINNRTEANQPNSISPTRLNKLMKHNSISWESITRKQVKLIITYHAPTPDDKYAASLNEIKVINSNKLTGLISIIRSMNPTKNPTIQKLQYFVLMLHFQLYILCQIVLKRSLLVPLLLFLFAYLFSYRKPFLLSNCRTL